MQRSVRFSILRGEGEGRSVLSFVISAESFFMVVHFPDRETTRIVQVINFIEV